jgi:hypothetical protein
MAASLNFSPSGRDQSEGAGCGNSFFPQPAKDEGHRSYALNLFSTQFKIVDITSFMVEFPSIGQKNGPDSVEFVSNAVRFAIV